MIVVTYIEKTCPDCPAQWEGRTRLGGSVYIRYRFGYLTVSVNGETVVDIQCGDRLDGYMDFKTLKKVLEGRVEFTEKERIAYA